MQASVSWRLRPASADWRRASRSDADRCHRCHVLHTSRPVRPQGPATPTPRIVDEHSTTPITVPTTTGSPTARTGLPKSHAERASDARHHRNHTEPDADSRHPCADPAPKHQNSRQSPRQRPMHPPPHTSPLRDDRALASIIPARQGWLSRWLSRLLHRPAGCQVCGRSLARCAYDGRHPEL